MVPEEYEVALIVKGDDPSSVELRIVGEDGGQQAPGRVAQSRVEVIQNHLRHVARRLAAPLKRQPKR